MMSLLPPGAWGTMTRIGFEGYACGGSSRVVRCAACALVIQASSKTSAVARLDFIPFLLPCRVDARLLPRRLARARPQHALLPRHRAHALVDELLQALTFVGLGRVEVALGIRRDAVNAIELPRLTP